MNILSLVAHRDDIDRWCGGTLLKYADNGHNVFIAVAAGDEDAAAAEGYGAQRRFLGFQAQGFADCPESRRAMRTAIRWANPEVVLTHAPWDIETDHAMTSLLAAKVLISVRGKLHPADLPPIDNRPHLFYFDTRGGVKFHPRAYVDIGPYMDKKIEMIRRRKYPPAAEGFLSSASFAEDAYVLARIRGMQFRCKYAEGFIGHSVFGHLSDYRRLP